MAANGDNEGIEDEAVVFDEDECHRDTNDSVSLEATLTHVRGKGKGTECWEHSCASTNFSASLCGRQTLQGCKNLVISTKGMGHPDMFDDDMMICVMIYDCPRMYDVHTHYCICFKSNVGLSVLRTPTFR